MKPEQIFSHWQQVRAGLLSIIDRFDESELAYKPFESSWPVGQIMLHIADAEEGWFRHVISAELDKWPDQYQLENYPTKANILEALSAVHTHTLQYLASVDEAQLGVPFKAPWGETYSIYWITWHVIEHEIHHRGELSLILGLLGRGGWGE
jgi:uncharacterized damage-inducible protein DinB